MPSSVSLCLRGEMGGQPDGVRKIFQASNRKFFCPHDLAPDWQRPERQDDGGKTCRGKKMWGKKWEPGFVRTRRPSGKSAATSDQHPTLQPRFRRRSSTKVVTLCPCAATSTGRAATFTLKYIIPRSVRPTGFVQP